jgi:hypothetical protein
MGSWNLKVGRILLQMKKQMLLNGNVRKAIWLLLTLYSSTDISEEHVSSERNSGLKAGGKLATFSLLFYLTIIH